MKEMFEITTFVIDMYEQMWDKEGFETEEIHLKTRSYKLNKTRQEFSEDMCDVLQHGHEEGYYLELNDFDSIVYVRVEMTDQDTYPFITDYLESNGEEVPCPNIPVKKSEILIEIYRCDETLSEEFIQDLQSTFGHLVHVSHSNRYHNNYTSDKQVDVLLWVSEGIGLPIIGDYLIDYFKKKKSNLIDNVNVIEDFNEDMMEHASQLSEVNKNDLRLIYFSYDRNDETTDYFITSKYVDIRLVVDSTNEVINYIVDKKSN